VLASPHGLDRERPTAQTVALPTKDWKGTLLGSRLIFALIIDAHSSDIGANDYRQQNEI
jgi:hypothetical protein